MLNVIKVLLDHLCQFVLVTTERAGITKTPRVLSEQSAYKSRLLAWWRGIWEAEDRCIRGSAGQ